jgi:hypothetical protein
MNTRFTGMEGDDVAREDQVGAIIEELSEILRTLLAATQQALTETEESRRAVATEVRKLMASMEPAETGSLLTTVGIELDRYMSNSPKAGATSFSIAGHKMYGVKLTDGNTSVSVGVEPSGDNTGVKGGGVQVEHTY